jgi:hypothetical protein
MKSKILYLLLAVSFGILNYRCSDKVLDILPKNILTADQVFQSESGITAYMVSLYNAMPMEDFNFYNRTNYMIPLSSYTDEAITRRFADEANNVGNGTAEPWWGYNNVRNVNDLMVKIPTSTLNESLKKSIIGEGKFLRAYYYFQMVKRYGGVPIVKTVQNFDGTNLAELQVPRNTEKEVYDFIASDLDSAALLLPETNVKGRVNKYAAYALKSRAMLYAASAAKYGSIQLNGILGIPASDANSYWKAAQDAANAVITANKYILYQANPDKIANFQEMFLLKDNPEALLSRFFSFPDKVHRYDCLFLPMGIKGPSGYGSILNPVLDFIEQFEYIDGTSGPLPMGTPAAPVYYTNPLDIYKNRDPRLLASIIVPFSSWRGTVIDVQAGIYDLGVKVEAGAYSTLYNVTTHKIDNANGTLRVVGSNGLVSTDGTKSGCYVRKYMDPALERSLATSSGSSQPWIEIRYAEVLLNYAEAAVELGNIAEAKAKMNIVRARAGIAAVNDAAVTIDKVRHERMVELAFENHRWWDMRRWRIADKILNNTRLRSIRPYYDVQQNAYRYESGFAGTWYKTFLPKVYYEMIANAELTKNPKLVQNPGY